MTRLSADQATALVRSVADELGRSAREKLAAMVSAVTSDGTIAMATALDIVSDSESHDAKTKALREFRAEVARAAGAAGVQLSLVADDRRRAGASRRVCWFEGEDPARSSLAARSRTEAQHGMPGEAVPPQVSEQANVVSAHVSLSPSDVERPETKRVVTALRTALRASSPLDVTVTTTGDAPLGTDMAIFEQARLRDADVVVRLLSPNYFADRSDMSAGRSCQCSVIDVVFSPVDPNVLASPAVHPWRTEPVTRHKGDGLANLVNDLAREVLTRRARLGCHHEDGAGSAGPRQWFANQEPFAIRDADDQKVAPQAASTALPEPGAPMITDPSVGPPLDAVGRLVEWATDDSATSPAMCALLGDLGMGKTTTAKLLTSRLLELRATDPSVPLPLYFDLREFDVRGLTAGYNLERVLDLLLARSDSLGNRPTGADVLRLLAEGNVLALFDGLDEVLVKLPRRDGDDFTRLLWRAVQSTRFPGQRRANTKLLLSCRTHFFRSMRDTSSALRGRGREGVEADDYLSLVMLPFTETQIWDYLSINLPGADVDGLMETLAAVHNLRDLASRPLLLKFLSRQIARIEAARSSGADYLPVDLYQGLVGEWLDREGPKHILLPEHKLLLMEELAAELVATGADSWSVQDLETWVLSLLRSRPDLTQHYEGWLPELFKDDLRTATFVVRRGDDQFTFAHTSLREYFHARRLVRMLSDDAGLSARAWAARATSRETLDFVGQLLHRLSPPAVRGVLARLEMHAADPDAALLAFRYAVIASPRGYPSHPLSATRLVAADLRGIVLEDLDLGGAWLRECRLVDTDLRRIDLGGSDLTGSDLSRSVLQSCRFDGALLDMVTLSGTVFRDCSGRPKSARGLRTYRTQSIRSDVLPAPQGGVAVAPRSQAPGGARLTTLAGHTSEVWSVGWSPDGARVVSGGGDRAVRVWDAVTGEHVLQLAGPAGGVGSVAWSPDGARVVAGGGHGAVRVWDAVTGEQLLQLAGPAGGVGSVAWSPDGARVVAGGGDGAVRVWDAVTGEQLLDRTGYPGGVGSVAWSPDGARLVSGSLDGLVRVWDAVTGEQLLGMTGYPGAVASYPSGVVSVAWSPDGAWVVSGSLDGSVRVWDAVTGEQVLQMTGHASAAWSVAWSPDGPRLASGSIDGSVRVWDAVTGEQVLQMSGSGRGVRSVAWSPDGARVVAGGGDGAVRVWDAVTGEQVLQMSGYADGVRSVAWSPDAARLASGALDGLVQVWDAVTGEQLLQLARHPGGVAWSPDGAQLVSGSLDGSVRVWEAVTGEQLLQMAGHTGVAWSVAWSPDGAWVASGMSDGSVRVWDAVTGEHLLQTTGLPAGVASVGWSPDGSRLVTGSFHGWVGVWDAVTGEPLLQLAGHTGGAVSVAWSPDGARLLSGSLDGLVWVWDAVTGEQLLQMAGHPGGVWSVAWSPDGARVVAGGGDGAVRVWDAVTGEQLLQLAGHSAGVRSVAWSPDGARLASCADDGVNVWSSDTGQPVGWRLRTLPRGNVTVWDATTQELLGASDEAWRWLGWQVPGSSERWPAESFGPLPALTREQGRHTDS